MSTLLRSFSPLRRSPGLLPVLPPVVALLALAACQSEPAALEPREVSLTMTSPPYGAFLGEGPIEVAGTVSDAGAVVLVEGRRVPVAGDGSFRTTLTFQGDYEVVDVRVGGERVTGPRARIPVFAGQNPRETWVDNLPVRLTNPGLARLGAALGAQVDATGWDAQLLAALPRIESPTVSFVPTAVTHDPTVVVLQGADGGLDVGIELRNVTIHTEVTFALFGRPTTLPFTIRYGTVTIGALAVPSIRPDDGVVVLRAQDTWVDFADPTFQLDGNDLGVLGWLADAAAGLLEPAAVWLSDLLVGVVGEIEVGGPFNLDTQVGEVALAIQLHEVLGDPEGLAMFMAVGLDEPLPNPPTAVPAPSPSTRVSQPVHLVAGLHEGLLDTLVGDQVAGALGEDLDLGPFALVVGNLVKQMPGGQFAPAGTWCVGLNPGPAQVVRLHDGVAPLGHLYLPDVNVDFAVDQGQGCQTWLKANLALDVALVVRGTEVGAEIAVGEGAVLTYGAPVEAWTEEAVIAALSDLVGTLAGAVAGQLSFNLADFGDALSGSEGLLGALGPLEPRILDSQPHLDEQGQPIPGMYAISMSLWAE